MMLCDAPRLMFCGIGKARGGIGREQRAISGQREAHCMVQGGLVDPALNARPNWSCPSSSFAQGGPTTTYSFLIRLLTGEC